VFVNNASLGVYARVVQSGSYRDAKLLTWARLLPDLLGPDADPIDLQFVGPDGTRYTDAELVLVSNNPYQVDQLAAAGTRPRMDTGMLGVVVARIRDNDGAEPTTLTPLLSGLITWTGTDFEVTSGAPVPVGLDGEAVTVEPPLRFRSLPGALRVRVPRHASGCAPPVRTVALSRDDLAALLTVALGRPRRDGTARFHP
jgi:diacylglycerol kinase family enzyme